MYVYIYIYTLEEKRIRKLTVDVKPTTKPAIALSQQHSLVIILKTFFFFLPLFWFSSPKAI